MEKEYYQKHRERICKAVAERYKNDPEHREKVLRRSREYHAKNRSRILKRMSSYGRKRRAAVSSKINAIKTERGCGNCGIKDFRVLDFHHRDPRKKSFCVSHTTKGEKKTLEEIQKCEVLCANCHRIVEHEKRKNVRILR